MRVRSRPSCGVLLAVAAVSGCGGGGGGDDSALATTASVTSANAAAVAGSALRVASSVSAVAFLVGGSFEEDGGAQSLGAIRGNQNLRRAALAFTGRVSPMAPIGPEIFDCDVDGTVEISGNLFSDTTYTPNDTLTGVFTDCDDGLGVVENGTLSFDIVSFSGDIFTGLYNVTADIDFTNYRLTLPATGQNFTWNGNAGLSANTTNTLETILSMTAGDLELRTNSATYEIFGLIMDAEISTVGSPAMFSRNVSIQATIDSTRFSGGDVDIRTTADLQGGLAGPFYAGTVVVTGKNSGMEIRPMDPPDVELGLDLDGDQTYADETIATTQGALLPAGT